MSAERPAPFIVYVECCYTDAEHKKPIATLRLSDESVVRLEPGEGYLGNGAGTKMLNALLRVEAFLSNRCAASDAEGYVPAPDSIIRARLETVREAIKEACK